MADKTPMDDEDSIVEAPSTRRHDTQRALGDARAKAAGSLKAPTTQRRGTKKIPRAAVGLRAAVPKKLESEATAARRQQSEQNLNDNRQAHREKVWAKLDEARAKADEKAQRLRSFEPGGGEAAPEDDDFDDFDF